MEFDNLHQILRSLYIRMQRLITYVCGNPLHTYVANDRIPILLYNELRTEK